MGPSLDTANSRLRRLLIERANPARPRGSRRAAGCRVLRYVSVVTDAAVDVFDTEAVLLLLLLTVTADLSGRSLLCLPLRLRLAMVRTPFSAPCVLVAP
jgi:hypothetical protein